MWLGQVSHRNVWCCHDADMNVANLPLTRLYLALNHSLPPSVFQDGAEDLCPSPGVS